METLRSCGFDNYAADVENLAAVLSQSADALRRVYRRSPLQAAVADPPPPRWLAWKRLCCSVALHARIPRSWLGSLDLRRPRAVRWRASLHEQRQPASEEGSAMRLPRMWLRWGSPSRRCSARAGCAS